MKGDNSVKRLFFIFINVIIISLFAALPCAADNLDTTNSSFTGVNFHWNSGPAQSPTAPSGFSHYLIIYSSPATWHFGDTEYTQYFIINDYITSINLSIVDGGCTLITTNPTSATPYSAYQRLVSYSFSSSSPDGYTIRNDSQNSVGRVYRDFSSDQSKRVCIFTDLPCYDQNGDPVGNIDTLPHFFMDYFVDGAGVMHHSIRTTSNNYPPINVTWYVVNGSVNTPSGAVFDTYEQTSLTEEYVDTNLSGFDYFRAAYKEYLKLSGGVLGQFAVDNGGLVSVFNKEYEFKIQSKTTGTIDRVNSFDIYDYYPFIHLGAYQLKNPPNVLYCKLDMNKWRKNLTLGGIYDLNHVAVIAVCTDGTTIKILRHDFNVSDVFSAMDNVDKSVIIQSEETPTPSNVSDWQTLADYLKNLQTNNNTNNFINYNNMLNGLTSFPWANVVNNGVAGALADFLPNLSNEFDSIFTGLFNDFAVPTQDQIDDIQEEIEAEQSELHDKLSFVEDVKTEIYFVSSSIAAAGSGEPHFKQRLAYYVPAYNEQEHRYYLSLERTPEEVTFFRGSWIDVNTRELLKDLITVFASLSVLLYIWRTLPATIGNMPTGKGD